MVKMSLNLNAETFLVCLILSDRMIILFECLGGDIREGYVCQLYTILLFGC